MDYPTYSRDDNQNTIILVYGLITVVVARYLVYPTWVLLCLFGLVLFQTLMTFCQRCTEVKALLGLLMISSIAVAFGSPFLAVFILFWVGYGVLYWNQRSKLIVCIGLLTGLVLTVLQGISVANLMEQSITLTLFSLIIAELGRKLAMERKNAEHMCTEIQSIKSEAASLQTAQDEKFKELLAAKVSMEERYAELYTLQIINDVANSELSIDILGEKVVDILTGLTGSTACSVILISPDQTLSILASSITSNVQKEALLTEVAQRLYHHVIDGNEAELSKEEQDLLKSRGIQSYVVVPLRLKTGGLGIIFAEHSVEHAFNIETRKILMTAADRLAIAIDNARLYDRMERMAVTDALTGVYNRLYLHQYLFKLFQDETPERLALAIIDADHFKKINDTYGHLTGDTALKQLASIAKSLLPPRGLVARYGGEEFVVIVPDYDVNQMKDLAESIRGKVSESLIRAENGREFAITISLGVSAVPDYAKSAESLLESADQALYRAKQNGRNQVCLAS